MCLISQVNANPARKKRNPKDLHVAWKAFDSTSRGLNTPWMGTRVRLNTWMSAKMRANAERYRPEDTFGFHTFATRADARKYAGTRSRLVVKVYVSNLLATGTQIYGGDAFQCARWQYMYVPSTELRWKHKKKV